VTVSPPAHAATGPADERPASRTTAGVISTLIISSPVARVVTRWLMFADPRRIPMWGSLSRYKRIDATVPPPQWKIQSLLAGRVYPNRHLQRGIWYRFRHHRLRSIFQSMRRRARSTARPATPGVHNPPLLPSRAQTMTRRKPPANTRSADRNLIRQQGRNAARPPITTTLYAVPRCEKSLAEWNRACVLDFSVRGRSNSC